MTALDIAEIIFIVLVASAGLGLIINFKINSKNLA